MLNIGVDWIALSFVQRPDDIVEIQRLILEHNVKNGVAHRPHVMAKIEKPSCFEHDYLERIVDLCDGVRFVCFRHDDEGALIVSCFLSFCLLVSFNPALSHSTLVT